MKNVKVKMRGKDTTVYGHTSILQFEIYNLHFVLAAANGRAMIFHKTHISQQSSCNEIRRLRQFYY